MEHSEILEYMLASVPNDYDVSVGSFFYDLLYPVAEQVYLLQNKISNLSVNAFALTAMGEYLDRKVAEQGIIRKAATYAKGTVRIEGNRGEVVLKGAKIAALVMCALSRYGMARVRSRLLLQIRIISPQVMI